MAQHYTDFSDTPAFTEEWHTTVAAVSIETSGLPTDTTGGAALKFTPSSADRYAASWDAVGAPSGDVDVYARLQVSSLSNAGSGRLHICGGGGTTDEDAYFVAPADITSNAYSYLQEYDAATSNTLAGPTTLSALTTAYEGVWFWHRLQKTGTTIRSKTWLGARGDEPGAWKHSVTDATHTGGWVGIGSLTTSITTWCDIIAVGTGGDAAPSDFPAAALRGGLLDGFLRGVMRGAR